MICRVEGVSFRYTGADRDALSHVSLGVERGTHVALVGPNGAGKSTLLRLITGVLEARQGTVTVSGRPIRKWKRRELAREMAVVSQAGESDSDIRVRDLVSLGRNPYVSAWAPLRAEDREVVHRCLASVDLLSLADRRATELSGGELQRARLARALAQQPSLLLLDEPTAHLDMGHETRFMELVSQQTLRESLTVIAVTHHLNTAARYADRIVLLACGSLVADGQPRDVLVPDLLEQTFGCRVHVADLGAPGRVVIPVRSPENR